MKNLLFILLFLVSEKICAQDSLNAFANDSNRRIVSDIGPPLSISADTSNMRNFIWPDSIKVPETNNLDSLVYNNHPFFRFTNPVRYTITIKRWEGKETVFYTIVALLLLFALIKNGFSRYISDLIKIFFRTTVKQRQIKDQLLQSPLPSLLLNLFFLLSGGMFLALALKYFNLGIHLDFWVLYFYCVVGLTAIYGIKFLTLKLLGWIFQVSDTIDAYIFIVFSTNKMIGMALVPLLVILAFTTGLMNQSAMTFSLIVVGGLFAYRFYLSYSSLHRQIQIGFFHFLLYLFAFEIVPLLLINKLLFRFLGETS